MIDRIKITATASGSAGSATGTAYSPHVKGEVLKVHVAYAGSPPATTDVTLADESDPADENVVNLANANTDVTLYPRRVVQDNAGNDVTFDGTNEIYEHYVVHGRLELTIAQANDGDQATATVWVRK